MKESTYTKNFSWIMKAKLEDGTIRYYNISDTAMHYKQSRYKTLKAAKKALQFAIDCMKKYHPNSEIIEAFCFTRNGERL